MPNVTIDLAEHGGPVYNGRPRGEALCAHFHLDEIDLKDSRVEVRIPEGAQAVTNSFVGGLFGSSIQRLGSREEFFQHFLFMWPRDKEKQEAFRNVIEHEVRRALFDKKPLLG